MNRGLYTAVSGGMVRLRQLDIVSNNLANVNTVGFKAQRLVTEEQEFSDTLASLVESSEKAKSDFKAAPGVVSVATTTDFTQGPIQTTENPLHVAIGQENAFFVLENDQGLSYTRAGNFTLDSERNLVSVDGTPVAGSGGAIQLPPGNANISSSGDVIVNGETIDRLRVVSFADLGKLQRVEGTRFKGEGLQPEVIERPLLTPRALEMPNINVVKAMVDLISAQRGFEAYNKTVKTIDDLGQTSLRTVRA
jgi:flagellar basal-body rod protein FlgG